MPTRKLFQSIADVIDAQRAAAEQDAHLYAEDDGDNLGNLDPVEYVKAIAEGLATVLAKENPRFDRARFLAACGWE